MSSEISIVIKELNRLDLEKVDYDKVIEKIKPLMCAILIETQKSNSTDMYFRSRICNDKEIENIKELSAPPNELVKGFQRCNPPGKSMFYSASKRMTTLLECNVQVGDIVYLSQWVNKEPIPLNIILYNDTETKISNELVLNYIDTVFTRQVHNSFSNAYKLTSAITELITSSFKPDKTYDIREDGEIALVYPSVSDILGGYNTVMSPSFANKRLEALHVMKLRITERKGNSIKVKVIDNAREVINGKIIWLNDKKKIPLKIQDKNGGIIFQYTGNKWSVPVGESELTEDIMNKLMTE